MNTNIVNADDVIGVNVENIQNESLGKVEAIMLDKTSGQVAYVVLSYGGFLGMGDKLFALPWSIFSYDASEDCFKIPLDKEKLKNSPGFDKDHWPDMSNTTWRNSINTYYGSGRTHM
ncbi:PRC-barrel domain-containing protein [Legionella shakespearei]|uniref:PRC-barrel domain protein n=1 Tax=Legionella shakespearei DSM 23087 TaxID=1122169 RepID=A0A0W0YI17_9GAMM|nr:PRC-barrel domain-containing protein [Legionella shakespearei]KTD56471.1 PRC-barrel domain protein [Legionella shakespearei DSM 23087]